MHNKLMPFTFFLDMLGFGNKIGHIDNMEEAEEFIDFMKNNKNDSHDWILYSEENDAYENAISMPNFYDFKFAFISDSIVMSYVPKHQEKSFSEEEYYKHTASLFYFMTNRINTIMINLLTEHKMLIRGGVSQKFSHIDNEFVVGKGIVEAYKLESKEAVYPRIILSKEISSNLKFMEAMKKVSNMKYGGKRLLKRDTDKFFYIDYLGYFFLTSEVISDPKAIPEELYEKYKEAILDHNKYIDSVCQLHKEAIDDMYIFLQSRKESNQYANIEKKYEWVKNYHNELMRVNNKRDFLI